jgi:hypothetical protein
MTLAYRVGQLKRLRDLDEECRQLADDYLDGYVTEDDALRTIDAFRKAMG